VLMASMFIGMASGAGLGSLALAQWGWLGVCGLAALAGLGALAVRLWPAAPDRI
jgi:predicted MFS family arabinose efflux permease